ncbi:MFS transporter [Tengunoibacter tsumagoiensis]|uniref:MFS transporter n=1 Tax=Tengunoibacter tsumagoiensis TaxID=2014871 RepID=A0A402A685_9CHLR|nr:MFS transporter [Tengunoibacter tsumagoiensis]GCE14653.1 MFS transporter [Tengunoibacter tsumagoiensis]
MDTIQEVRSQERPTKSPWLINRNYRLLFFGQAISLIGDQLSAYTLLLWIVLIIARDQSWAPVATGAVLVAGMVPNLTIGPLAGVFVDRWNHRLTMLRTDLLRAICTLFLLLGTGIVSIPFLTYNRYSSFVQLAILIVVAFFISAFSQFFAPAYTSLIADIVPDKQRPQAAAYGQAMTSFAMIIGPPLAAPLLITFGLQWALFIDVLSYVVSLLTLWAIRPPVMSTAQAAKHGSIKQEFVAGLRFSFGHEIIRMLIVVSVITAFGVGAFENLYLYFIKQNLHTDVKMIGLIGAVLSFGTIIGALFASRLCTALGSSKTLYSALAVLGCIIMVLSRMTNFISAVIVIFLLGLVASCLRVAVAPLMLEVTPKQLIGRVVSVMNPLAAVASLLSAVIAGICAGVLLVHFQATLFWFHFGPIDTIFIGVGLLFLIAACYAYLSTQRRSNSDA